MTKRSAKIAVVVGITLGLGVAYLFRQRTLHTGDAWGDIRLVWKWGKAAEMRIDWDRDGKEDSRMIFHRWSTEFTNHEAPDETYEDTHHLGRFDLHVTFANGKLQVLKRDLDGDGVFEQVLEGQEARNVYDPIVKAAQAFHEERLDTLEE